MIKTINQNRKEIRMNVGKTLSELRIKKKKSRLEMARDIGVSKSAIAMYERGERIPKDSIKVKIAAYFQKSVESIFFTK